MRNWLMVGHKRKDCLHVSNVLSPKAETSLSADFRNQESPGIWNMRIGNLFYTYITVWGYIWHYDYFLGNLRKILSLCHSG